MDIYWYWPYLRREELVLAPGVLHDGDRLVVHTTPRPTDPITAPTPACEIRDDLPAVSDAPERSARWAASRAATYVSRARSRRRAVSARRFDVAHLVYLNPFTDAFDLRRLARRVPLVASVHDVVPHQSRVPAPVERRLLAAQYRHAGILVAHHESVRRRLLEEFAIDPDRVVVNPLPISIEPVVPRADGTAPTVLLFGTFRRNKGIAELLQAIEALRGAVDARFLFAGRGFPDVESEVLAAASRDDRIEVEIGYATAARKRELYGTADLVTLPYTTFASQSAVLQDAYAHRVPLVVSDVGALGETVRADASGWVVRPGDVDGLAATLLDALGNPAGRAEARAAMARVAEARTPERVGAQLRAIYTRAADRG
ncbi:MAG TPA: glycosyltransferase family 4 protein [Acidimicrobiia bacterium]